MSKICFAVLHYGNHDVTEKCVQSILKLRTKHQVRVLIIDNDSRKQEQERFEYRDIFKEQPVEYLTIREQSGFSKANNRGYEYLREKYQPDFVVMTNNDISFIQEDFCERLVASYEQNQYDVLGPDIISEATGEHQNPIDETGRSKVQASYTIFMNRLSLAVFPLVYPLLKKKFCPDRESVPNIDRDSLIRRMTEEHQKRSEIRKEVVPCGACLVFSTSFIQREDKAFSPETEFYYEEYILYERCRRQHAMIIYDSSMWVLHGDGVATKRKAGNEKNKMRFMLENTCKSAKKYRDYMTKKE